jgi:hypothetical protein
MNENCLRSHLIIRQQLNVRDLSSTIRIYGPDIDYDASMDSRSIFSRWERCENLKSESPFQSCFIKRFTEFEKYAKIKGEATSCINEFEPNEYYSPDLFEIIAKKVISNTIMEWPYALKIKPSNAFIDTTY